MHPKVRVAVWRRQGGSVVYWASLTDASGHAGEEVDWGDFSSPQGAVWLVTRWRNQHKALKLRRVWEQILRDLIRTLRHSS